MKRIALTVAATALAAGSYGLLAPSEAQAQQQFVTVGTGGVTGVYYPAGGAICRLVNQNRQEHGIRCSDTAAIVFDNCRVGMGLPQFGKGMLCHAGRIGRIAARAGLEV